MWLEPNEDEMGLHIHAYEHKQQVFRLYDVWACGKHEYIVIDIVDHTVLLAEECWLTGSSISYHLALIAVASMLMAQGKVAEQRTSGLAAYLRVTTILCLQHWGKEGVEKVRKTCDVKPAGPELPFLQQSMWRNQRSLALSNSLLFQSHQEQIKSHHSYWHNMRNCISPTFPYIPS